MCFKYNCLLQFADSSASMTGILFDNVAHKLIGNCWIIKEEQPIKSANYLNSKSNQYFKTFTFDNTNSMLKTAIKD